MSTMTLAILKPDTVAAGNAGKVLAHLESKGFTIRGLRVMHLTEAQAQAFYAVHRERPFFASLVKFMTEGPVMPVALERRDGNAAVPFLRNVPAVPVPARPVAQDPLMLRAGNGGVQQPVLATVPELAPERAGETKP